MSAMTRAELVDCLKIYADASARAATTVQGAGRARLNFMASLLLDAADRLVLQTAEIDTLRTRLLRQASWFEQFEAAMEPPTWPLLEDDCDPGSAL